MFQKLQCFQHYLAGQKEEAAVARTSRNVLEQRLARAPRRVGGRLVPRFRAPMTAALRAAATILPLSFCLRWFTALKPICVR